MKMTKLAVFGAVAALAVSAQASLTVWDGGGDGVSWTDNANWVGDPATIPHNDYDADFNFGDFAVTPTTITRTLTTTINDLSFTTAGWTISGSGSFDAGGIKSYGAGTNTISMTWNQFDNNTYDVGAGNILQMSYLYQRNKDITKSGSGMLDFLSKIGGYGGSLPTWGIHVTDGLVRIEASTPYTSSAGTIFISSATGTLQLKTSNETSVQAMFGTRIVDQVGNGLSTRIVNDLTSGNTYVEVYSIPEPASIALLACGLGLVIRRQSRKA